MIVTPPREPLNRACPKIELHVHLEGTIRAETILRLARRHGVELDAQTPDELAALLQFRDFDNFIEVFLVVTDILLHGDDFREILVEYAEAAATHGVVYLEGIFSPAQAVRRGVSWDSVFSGYCDGIEEARERHGVEVRLTPDVTRSFPLEIAEETARHAIAYRDRGVVGLGLGGYEADYPPEPFAGVFERARDAGLGSVPHAGEVAGPESVRGALDSLSACRIRHGIAAAEDDELMRELAERRVVLDVCPTSNVLTGVVRSLDEHPLPRLLDAGISCSISTDDPAFFNTDLTREYEAAWSLGLHPRETFAAGVAGALCEEDVRDQLRAAGEAFDWDTI
jgi:aminodeoxyfutalosine deaminase